jgi:predicted acylesterase/phospholipase RssA
MEEICIGGGGIKGIGFLGALYELEINGLIDNVKRYSGASIGGFFAVLLCIGYKPSEIIDKVFEYNLNDLKDVDFKNSFNNMSLMIGERFHFFIKKLISEKENPEITLKDLFDKTQKEIIISVTCVNDSKVEYINYKSDPHLTIFKLVCMTTSIPIIFPPIIYKNKYYADGGIIDNFPMCVLSDKSWGITSITSKNKITKEFTFFTYVSKILHIVYSNLQEKISENYKNVIKVDVKHINVTSFNISNDDKLMLVNKGRQAVKEKIETIRSNI